MSMSNDMPHEFWYESAGAHLFAVERGRGLPIIFLHGGLADHRASTFRMGFLAGSHRLITPDVRGAGRSIYAGDLSWDLLTDDVLALMQHLQIERAVIGGVSAGTGVALRFALRHRERTRALLLVSPVHAGQDRGDTPAQREAKARMKEAGERALAEGIEAILPLYERLPPEIRSVALEMARAFDPRSVAATTRFLVSGFQPIAHLGDLTSLTMPTLVIPGTDPEHPRELAQLYAETIPHALLVEPAADRAANIESFLSDI